ncbi:MAG: gamma-glutamylcyclotransferase [Pseudomonadota bacterium]
MSAWIFGYGSLIWRPDIEYKAKSLATLSGYARRFWQGSHDHRGTPDAPGRVVTLIEDKTTQCVGMAYLVESHVLQQTYDNLDYREKNGYERFDVSLTLDSGAMVNALTYIAPPGNFAYLGDAPIHEIAKQIHISHGPSGANKDYLLELAQALRRLDIHDEHIFELESLIQALLGTTP